MAKPKDPATPRDTKDSLRETTEAVAGQPLEAVVEALARASGSFQGLTGEDLQRHVAGLVQQVESLSYEVQAKMQEDSTRQEAAAEMTRLVDLLGQTSAATGAALAPHREQIAQLLRQIDLNKISAVLQLVSKYLASPTPATEKEIKVLVGELQQSVGPMVGHDPAREDEQRREEIKADVRARLDKIFRKPKPE